MTDSKKWKGWNMFVYYQWLLEKIDGYKEPWYNYSLLLHELHSIKFEWNDRVPTDENRASDGVKLRWIFMDEMNIADIFYKDKECSVLEMLVGLSVRCECEIMGNGSASNAAQWFWIMIDNLDLLHCKDDNFSREYVHQQVKIWMNREFHRNGKGSPFPLKRCRRDQRNVEIWFQFMQYLNENYL